MSQAVQGFDDEVEEVLRFLERISSADVKEQVFAVIEWAASYSNTYIDLSLRDILIGYAEVHSTWAKAVAVLRNGVKVEAWILVEKSMDSGEYIRIRASLAWGSVHECTCSG